MSVESDPVNDMDILIEELSRDSHALTDIQIQDFIKKAKGRMIWIRKQRGDFLHELGDLKIHISKLEANPK